MLIDAMRTGGCIKLDASGAIVEREVAFFSGHDDFDRSVALAIERATDMAEPVPAHLEELLIEHGVCFRFVR